MSTVQSTRQLGEVALERADAGERLSAQEILALYAMPPDEVIAVAHDVRLRRVDPEHVTFSLGGNIDYTTICTIACGFCTFYRTPRQEGAYALTPDEVVAQVASQVALGCTEVLIEGGINPDLPLQWYLDVLRGLKASFPALHVDFLSPEEIRGLERLTGRDASDILAELQAAGMDGLPGASAEILVDEVRSRVSPQRISTADWLRIVEAALQLGLLVPWTGLVFGLGETLAQRVEHLLLLRELQDRDLERGGRGLNAYKVWPMRLNDTRLRRRVPVAADEEVIESYVRQVAIHRLALDNVSNHRSVWRTMGYGVAARALRAGANDLCGTGSINAVTSVLETAGAESLRDPSERILHGVLGCIEQAGFRAAQRDAFYNVINHHDPPSDRGQDYVGGFSGRDHERV